MHGGKIVWESMCSLVESLLAFSTLDKLEQLRKNVCARPEQGTARAERVVPNREVLRQKVESKTAL